MPRWLRRQFLKTDLWTHFLIALVIGFIFRVFSAYFVYGPQALDDYKHGVWPAYQVFAGLPLDLPLYRSPLLVWILSGFVWLASLFSWTSALAQVRAMYLGLGLISLSAIYGTYLYVRWFRSRVFAALALYMVAVFPLMPFISTRAFGEAVAMSLTALAFGLLESARRSKSHSTRAWINGFLVLGLATLLRFHVGLIYIGYLFVLAFLRAWREVTLGVLSGFLVLAGAAFVDIAAGRAPLSTLLIYLMENEGGGAKYGVSPWYNPLLFLLAVSLAPFSFLLWRETRALWRRHWPVLVPAIVFVVAHMFATHKEERFLYPIVVIELWAIAFLWSSAAFNKWVRRIYAPVCLGLTAVLLPIVCLVNTQEGEIEPPALLESRYKNVLFLDYESLFGKSRFQFYFLRPPSELRQVTLADFTAHTIDEALAQNPNLNAVAFLTSDLTGYDQMRMIEDISTIEGVCHKVEASGSIMDRLLYFLNPKHNQRRRPTWYLVCDRRKSI